MTTYAVMLRATTDDRSSVHALRAVLKFAKRRGLLAVDVCELPSTNNNQTIRRHDARRQIVTITQQRRGENIMTSLKKNSVPPANISSWKMSTASRPCANASAS